MSEIKTDAEIVQWAVGRSRSHTRKAYPWHELQEIALAMEHGLSENEAFEQAEATLEPLSNTLPPTLRKRHDVARVAHLRNLITRTNWSQAEREYDEAKRQDAMKVP